MKMVTVVTVGIVIVTLAFSNSLTELQSSCLSFKLVKYPPEEKRSVTLSDYMDLDVTVTWMWTQIFLPWPGSQLLRLH